MNSSTVFSNVGRVASVLQAAHATTTAGHDPCRVGIYVAADAPADLVSWVRRAFTPLFDTATITVERISESGVVRLHSSSTFVVCIAGSASDALEELLLGFAHDMTPCVVVAESTLDAPEIHTTLPEGAQLALVSATSEAALETKLSQWIADTFPDNQSIARSFAFVRAEKSRRLIGDVMGQNALVGALGFMSGAHLPIMTINQARLALSLGNVYGSSGVRAQAPVLASVVGAAFVWRQLARGALKHLDGIAPVVRAFVAAAGTFVVGRAAEQYFSRRI